MSQVLQYRVVLFGPRRGQTININGHQFFNGICQEIVATEAAASFLKVLSFYGAYAYGTPEYDDALKVQTAEDKVVENGKAQEVPEEKKEVAVQEAPNGTDNVQTSTGSGGSNEVSNDGGPVGAGPTETSADDIGGTDEITAGSAGADPSGDGYEDSGVPKFEDFQNAPQPAEPSSVGSEDIKVAILKLDPNNVDHWSKRGATVGKPSLSAVEEALGRAGLTRDDLEAALPGWNRNKAKIAAEIGTSAEKIGTSAEKIGASPGSDVVPF